MEEESRQRAQDALELARRQEDDEATRRAQDSPFSKSKIAAETH
jgi:hypothetical protein